MLLTPQHRRNPARRSRKMEPANVEKFPPNQLELASNNELLQLGLQPRGGLSNPKNSIIESESEVEEDIYDDCPDGKGYEYDKDMYLANDKYAKMVDEEIEQHKEKIRLRYEERLSNWLTRKPRYFDCCGNEI